MVQSISGGEQTIEDLQKELLAGREQAVIAYLKRYKPSDLLFFRVPAQRQQVNVWVDSEEQAVDAAKLNILQYAIYHSMTALV